MNIITPFGLSKKSLQLKINVRDFLKRTTDELISPQDFYTALLSQIFVEMRKNTLSDNEIDDILCNSFYPSSSFIFAANNN